MEPLDRRNALRLLGGAGVIGLAAACHSGSSPAASATSSAPTTSSTTSPTSSSTASATGTSTLTETPEETAGPFPGDGSNGPDVLNQSGVVRQDIRSSFGSATGTAEGVPLTIAFTVLELAKGAAPLQAAAVYVWHCDRDGNYSMYGAKDANYLRGVQATDANGTASFTSIFPGCYSGRWPHIHFEVYPSVDAATSSGQKLKTSQIALPQDACEAAYATAGYSSSTSNLKQVSLSTDMVFADGWSAELGTADGDPASGMRVALTVAV